ncbi:MAG TPA: NlpC/P60 family protein [Arachidicoccus sp.]|nr:NlpC/P60 family protein [Arachidicoccus sp.]
MKVRHHFFLSLHVYLMLSCGALLFISCSSSRQSSGSATAATHKGPRFLNDISVNPGDRVSSRNKSFGYIEEAPDGPDKNESQDSHPALSLNEETLVNKYAGILGVTSNKVRDIDLFEEVDDWYGTPYSYGGSSKNGIDCSAFSRTLFNEVYNKSLPRTAQQQYDYCRHIKKNQLEEGDLVFFHTTSGSRITHVGIYLQNGKFVHASTSSGVMISDLDDYYWRKTYRAAGRIPDKEVTIN